jgi:hypothetical protein
VRSLIALREQNNFSRRGHIKAASQPSLVVASHRHRFRKPSAPKARPRRRRTFECVQDRANMDDQTNEHRTRISGQPEEGRVAGNSEEQWLSRPLTDTVKDTAHAKLAGGPNNAVMIAERNSTSADYQIGPFERAAQGAHRVPKTVCHVRHFDAFVSTRSQPPCDHRSVRVRNLSAFAGGAGPYHFIAGDHDGDSRRAANRNTRDRRRRQSRYMCGREARAAVRKQVAFADFLASAPEVLSRTTRLRYQQNAVAD